MRQLFAELGLTENENKIYDMLLHEGASLAGKITQKTGIHRRNVYDCLERLIQKGLVAYIRENNRKVYAITDPRALSEKMAQQTRELESMMPTLLALYNSKNEKKETTFFRGTNGIKQVMQDQLSVGKEVLVLATTANVKDVVKYFFPRYQLVRRERKIPTRMLFDDSFRPRKKQLADLPYCKIRFIPELNRSPMAQYIYGDNVALVVYGDDPIAILIRQKEISKGFADNFEVLWKLGKP